MKSDRTIKSASRVITVYLCLAWGGGRAIAAGDNPPIDRQAVVARHAIETKDSDLLMVGNGEFAFNADFTGLQTFEQSGTFSHWGWHMPPLPGGKHRNLHACWPKWDATQLSGTTSANVEVPPTVKVGKETVPFSWWLRANPHRMNLGVLGFEFRYADGTVASREELEPGSRKQRLDLWTGLLTSEYALGNEPVKVQTCVHSDLDAVAVRVASPLVRSGCVSVTLRLPYCVVPSKGVGRGKVTGLYGKDLPHNTVVERGQGGGAVLRRTMDDDAYEVRLSWKGDAVLKEVSPQVYELAVTKSTADVFELVCLFSQTPYAGELPGFEECRSASAAGWESFWKSGAAIDLSGSKDPRWKELERRIVLSQYVLRANEAGSWPSPEAGLLTDCWYGKFHMEMYWWHAAHYALWNRWPLLERSLGVYERFRNAARETARKQGYRGARWQKMTAPGGWDSPSGIAEFLIWQQPHAVFFADLDYRRQPTRQTLERWNGIVEDTAEFMASFAAWDVSNRTYRLGPGIITMPENNDRRITINPAFELSYWRYGLRVAQEWRERQGLARNPEWDKVLLKLAPLPVQEGVYLQQEGMTDTYTRMNWEHPGLVGVYGMLPGDGVDRAIAHATVRKVFETWKWDYCWGWDFPMMAMAAARVGEPKMAIDMLLHASGKNAMCANGFSRGGPYPYFPSNGGLLYAVAMMAAGWDPPPSGVSSLRQGYGGQAGAASGGPETPSPGFPADGSWSVKAEGFAIAP